MKFHHAFSLRKTGSFGIKILRSFELRSAPVNDVLNQGKTKNHFVMPTLRSPCRFSAPDSQMNKPRTAGSIMNLTTRILPAVAAAILVLIQTLPADAAQRNAAVTEATQTSAQFYSLPLQFEQNAGQADASVKFLSRGPGYGIYLKPTEAVLALHVKKPGKSIHGHESLPPEILSMRLLDASGGAFSTGLEKLPGTVNYFTGAEAKAWHSGLSTFARVRFTDVYPGIDIVYYGTQRQLEYDFIVAPQSDP
jgi:hypothetical protein